MNFKVRILDVQTYIMYFLFFGCTSRHAGILVPQPGVELVPPAVEARSLNHWTAREVPRLTSSLALGRLMKLSQNQLL